MRNSVVIAGLCAGFLLCVCGCTETEPSKDGEGSSGTSSLPAETQNRTPAIPLSPDGFRLALQLRNIGIAAVENLEFADADRLFSQLRELVPGNELPVRNLAITRVLSVIDRRSPYSRSKDAAAYTLAVKDAEDAIASYREIAQSPGQRALADLLAGRLAAHDDTPENPRIDEAVALLKQAAAESGDQPEYWYAVATVMEGNSRYSQSAELINVLRKCRELAPDNLFVLARLLDALALAVNAEDTAVRDLGQQLPAELKAAIPLLEPLNSEVMRQRGIDLLAMVREAGDAGQAPAAVGAAMMTKNLLVAELAAQIDQRSIDRNLLDSLLLDFAPRPELQPGVWEDVHQFQVDSVLEAFEPATGLPALTGVTDVQCADFDLDAVDDLMVARDGKFEVHRHESGSSDTWTLMCEFAQPEFQVDHFLVADLTRDFDRRISDVKAPMLLRDQDGDQKVVTDPAGQHRWYDTDLDVVLWGPNGLVIARNELQDNTSRTLIPLPQSMEIDRVTDVVAADIEADGDLDLVIATESGLRLWRNLDGTQFAEWDAALSLPQSPVTALAAVDWNRDMAMDIIAVTADGHFGVLQNILHGRMRWTESTPLKSAGSQLTVGDFNRDTAWDAVVTGAPCTLVTAADETGFDADPGTAAQCVAGDFDNDGCVDLMQIDPASGRLSLQRGRPDGEFTVMSDLSLPDAAFADGCPADVDDDGDLDLVMVVSADRSLQLLTNQGGDQNNWIDVVPRAVPNDPQFPSNRVNMHAIGGVIELRGGPMYQAIPITSPRLHIGLGKLTQIESVRVIWTDGVPQHVLTTELLKARVGILAPQILMGSCPYIYTWTGESFEFFSDCLWAAPIGLIQANGEPAPSREWEHLLIPSDRFRPRDGRYVLQLTEELWETAYFDEVRLMAVDHPADISVLTNEKVGSPAMAQHRIHTVKHKVPPDRVVDRHGNDLTSRLLSQDGDYVQPFEGRIVQGLTDEWVMEFHCGLPRPPQSLRLVLVGWVFPTDTSLNLAIRQNPSLQPPLPPLIETLNEDGEWVVAIPFIGFPGGKTKSMVVDLTEVIHDADVRFRIRSGMELYFDTAWFIVDEQDVPVVAQECDLVSAHLHYRGFSRRQYSDNALFRDGQAPESYDYDAVTVTQRWPTIGGRFTRYGDATSLIADPDDLLVVMAPGDELTVTFEAPPEPVPDGWVRDYVLSNVGWDKDANLNTVYGQSSEPYPVRNMSGYPFDDAVPVVDREQYERYLEEFQTRQQTRQRFQHEVRFGAAE